MNCGHGWEGTAVFVSPSSRSQKKLDGLADNMYSSIHYQLSALNSGVALSGKRNVKNLFDVGCCEWSNHIRYNG